MLDEQLVNTQSLTPPQLKLLERLAFYFWQGKLYDPIVPIPRSTRNYAIYVRGEDSLILDSTKDLDALVDIGVLSWEFNRMGNGRMYVIDKAAAKILDTFRMLEPQAVKGKQAQAWSQERMRFTELSRSLKGALAGLLGSRALEEAIMSLEVVKGEVHSAEPNPIRISEQLQTVGGAILTNFTDEERALATCNTLDIFTAWSRLAYQLLDE